jgi:hypothetical protein
MTLSRALLFVLKLISTQLSLNGESLRVVFNTVPGCRLQVEERVKEAALGTLLSWQPEPWAIPSDDKLLTVLAQFYTPGDDADNEIPTHFRWAAQFKWFFSPTAIGIHSLENHPLQRAQMRCIILREDHHSVSDSESHLRGLVDTCNNFPRLQVERRVGYWSSIYHHDWQYLSKPAMAWQGDDDMAWLCHDDMEYEFDNADTLLYAISEWYLEAKTLQTQMAQ